MSDRQMTPTERLEALTSLYERQAYLAWNVALRTALADDRASGAARRAFLAQVTDPDEPRVACDAARFAAEGPSATDSRQIEEPVRAASARLAPAQRAVLALTTLAEASPERAGAALGIDAGAVSELARRGYEELGVLLGTSAEDARDAYADLEWAPPPEALWAELYPSLHGAVTQHARALAQAAPPDPAPSPRRRMPGSRLALAGVAVLAVAGVAWAASGGSDDDAGGGGDPGFVALESDGSAGGSPAAAGDPPRAADTVRQLSPEELDRLRREEIEDLKRFTRRKANEELPPRARRRAARKVDELVKLAQGRQRAAERRELALRRALARERQARLRERERRRREEGGRDRDPAPREQPAPAQQPSQQTTEPRDEPDRRDGNDDKDEAQAECLYDADSGSYICPE
jgi:DNA-directed RNA polymerase specialized sigma24 family protein